MDKKTLRKVQNELLSILYDIDKVCKENDIQYFLDSGTLIGAIRHKGFIPWDDDLDIGMLREEYERFNSIAQEKLGDKYFWQTWDTDDGYALPFGKVRKRNTVYLEKKSRKLKENGFFVDVIPYDYAPEDEKGKAKLKRSQINIYREILMKSHYTPWIIDGKVDYKRRIGYILYQVKAFFSKRKDLINKYNNLTQSVTARCEVYEQTGQKYYPVKWMKSTILSEFEGGQFPVISHFHDWLTVTYGDYMTPPPEDQRENMHQIYEIKFEE